MELEVLVSSMNQKEPITLFEALNIRSNVLLINQCDHNDTANYDNSSFGWRCINTTERGLSNSRNMAIANAMGEICLLCDDDEHFFDCYRETIVDCFEENNKYDIICFKVEREGKDYWKKKKRIGYVRSLKISSVQIAFRKNSIQKKHILFDNNFGAGTEIGAGEENIFLYECLKNKLRILYVPLTIGRVDQLNSSWFKGFDKQYFTNRGKIIKKLMGPFLGFLYCIYFAISKYKRYKRETGFFTALTTMIKNL